MGPPRDRVPSGLPSVSGPPPGGMWDRQNPGTGPLRDGVWNAPVKMEEDDRQNLGTCDGTGPPRDGMWNVREEQVMRPVKMEEDGPGPPRDGMWDGPASEVRMGPPQDRMWERKKTDGMWDGPASGAKGGVEEGLQGHPAALGALLRGEGFGLPARYLGADQAPGVEEQVMRHQARMGLLRDGPPAGMAFALAFGVSSSGPPRGGGWDGPASGSGMSSQQVTSPISSPRGVWAGPPPMAFQAGMVSGPPPGGIWDRQNPGAGALRSGMWDGPASGSGMSSPRVLPNVTHVPRSAAAPDS